MLAIALAVWFGIVGFLAGGKLATDGKIKVKSVKAEAPKTSFLRPCVGAYGSNCDK